MNEIISTIKAGDFGKDFLWGTATSAYQIESAWNVDGKAPSIWDTFTHKKGKVKKNENADTACNSYHRYTEDVNLIHSMGMQAYRFSLAWSRILSDPLGREASHTW